MTSASSASATSRSRSATLGPGRLLAVTARAERVVHYSSEPARIALVPEQSLLVADGVTRPVITVRITDQCPECKTGDLDLSESAFARIADPVAGRVPIRWHVVPGDVTGPVSYRYKEGSSRWWVAIQVRNHRLPITGLEIKPSGSADWIAVARTDYNYFVHPSAIATGPLQVRITALGGATLIDTLPEPSDGVVVAGAGQFP